MAVMTITSPSRLSDTDYRDESKRNQLHFITNLSAGANRGFSDGGVLKGRTGTKHGENFLVTTPFLIKSRRTLSYLRWPRRAFRFCFRAKAFLGHRTYQNGFVVFAYVSWCPPVRV